MTNKALFTVKYTGFYNQISLKNTSDKYLRPASSEISRFFGYNHRMQILSHVSALGLGGILGIWLKSLCDYRLTTKKMLLEARIKAYSGMIGQLFNIALAPDMTSLSSEDISIKLNQLFAETLLNASVDSAELINQYKQKVG